MTLVQIENEALSKVLFNSLMRKLLRCFDKSKGETNEQMHVQMRNIAVNVQMKAELASDVVLGAKSIEQQLNKIRSTLYTHGQ